MKDLHVILAGVGILIAVLGFNIPSHAMTGDQILTKVDQVANAPKDREATLKMILVDKNGDSKRRELTMWQKGDQKRLVRFLSPSDVKGVGFLSLTEEQMYLYMPAFKKIRRVASHIKNESFMSTDFSYDDMAQTKLTDDYITTSVEETETHYLLELIPKPGSDVGYSRLSMRVDKKTFVYDKAEYYDRKDKLQKVLTVHQIKLVDNYWTPTEMEMYDVQKEHKTTLIFTDIRHDTGLGDELFTQRYLKRV
jgi:outer membrane lipoprotein-sorting protein